jgi:hypothetical protein
VLLVLAAVAGGLLIGRLRHGSFARLGALPLRSHRLVLAAVAAQVVGILAPWQSGYPLGLAVSALLAATFVLRNRGVPGLGLVLAGLVCNVVAVGANEARMPVSLDAAARIGQGAGSLLRDPLHIPASSHTRLRVLTDWIPVVSPLPVGSAVASPGDILIAAGAALLVEEGTALGAGARRPRGRGTAPAGNGATPA